MEEIVQCPACGTKVGLGKELCTACGGAMSPTSRPSQAVPEVPKPAVDTTAPAHVPPPAANVGNASKNFEHHAYPSTSVCAPDQLRLELSRAAEIPAGRIGVACCRSTDHAIRAIVKTSAGLGDDHLKFDLVEDLRQGAALKNEPDPSLSWSTPPLILRARAALCFDSVLHGARAGEDFTPPACAISTMRCSTS